MPECRKCGSVCMREGGLCADCIDPPDKSMRPPPPPSPPPMRVLREDGKVTAETMAESTRLTAECEDRRWKAYKEHWKECDAAAARMLDGTENPLWSLTTDEKVCAFWNPDMRDELQKCIFVSDGTCKNERLKIWMEDNGIEATLQDVKCDGYGGRIGHCDPSSPPLRDPHACVGKDYCIHVCKWGIAISGGVPVSDLKGISEKYGMGKTAVASMRIAHSLGVALVFCKSAEDEQSWWDMILFMNDLKDTQYPTPSDAGA